MSVRMVDRNMSLFSACVETVYIKAKPIIKHILTQSFYAGFKKLDPVLAALRRQELFDTCNAEEFRCTNQKGMAIDAVYIRSASESCTGNVLVICLNTTYQDHHPRHWKPFLENGADILLWNPTELGSVSYSQDLSALLSALRAREGDQVIAVKTYCASTDPGIKAVAEQGDDVNMHLIIDRGHGDVSKLSRSFSIFSKLPLVERVLKEEFDCKGIEKIDSLRGRILFLTPDKIDQVMDCGNKRNLTRDLYAIKSDQVLFEMEGHDHWSKWSYEVYNEAFHFLSDLRVVQEEYTPISPSEFPSPQPLDCWKKQGLPLLTKAWC